jgi:hypothetical protein
MNAFIKITMNAIVLTGGIKPTISSIRNGVSYTLYSRRVCVAFQFLYLRIHHKEVD